MLIYQVTVELEETLARRFVEYMREKHLPEIFATGCFRTIQLAQASPTRFQTCYEAATAQDLDRYLSQHTPHFREDFHAHFPHGCTVSREVWEVLERQPTDRLAF